MHPVSYQRRLRAYELTIEGIIANPSRATNEEYRELIANLEDTLAKYRKCENRTGPPRSSLLGPHRPSTFEIS